MVGAAIADVESGVGRLERTRFGFVDHALSDRATWVTIRCLDDDSANVYLTGGQGEMGNQRIDACGARTRIAACLLHE